MNAMCGQLTSGEAEMDGPLLDISRIIQESEQEDDRPEPRPKTTGTTLDPTQENVALESRPKTTGITQITSEILTTVCSTLQAEGYLPQDTEAMLTITRDMDTLKEQLQFLENCLLPRGKFANATAEKAWKRFHAACSEKISQLSLTLNLKTGAAFQLCLRLFQILVELNYKNSPPAGKPTIIIANVSKEDREVLHYIGGSIVHSVKGKVMSSKKNKETKLDVLETLVVDKQFMSTYAESDGTHKFTSLLDRGGLIYVKPSMVNLLAIMECGFRSKFSDAQSCSREEFVADCLANDAVTTSFYEACYDSFAEDEDKEYILLSIVNLFFTIRIHHECKIFMDNYRHSKQMSKKQKSMRKKLKKSADETQS